MKESDQLGLNFHYRLKGWYGVGKAKDEIKKEDCFEIFRANAGRIGMLGSCAKDVAIFYSEVKKLYHKKKDGKVPAAVRGSVLADGEKLKLSLEKLNNRCYIGWLFCR